MNRLNAFRFAPLLLAAVSAHAMGATSRSGSLTAVRPTGAPSVIASPLGCIDRVFANGVDDGSRGVCGADTVTVFTDRTAFLAALAPGQVEHSFDEVTQGAAGGLHYTDGGFDYLIYTEQGASGALYNGPGYVSTDRVDDQIWVSTTIFDAPITAMGANIWPSDFSLLPTTGTVVLTVVLQDATVGAVETIETNGPDDFRGFTSTTPIAYVIVEAPDLDAPPPGATPDRWPTLDNLIIGTAQ